MEAWAAAVEAVKQVGTIEEPAVTWNLLVTAGTSAILGLMVWRLQYNLRSSDAMKQKYFEAVIGGIKDSIETWQDGARERTKTLCEKIDKISTEMKEKVSHEACHERHDGLKHDINDLKSKIWA